MLFGKDRNGWEVKKRWRVYIMSWRLFEPMSALPGLYVRYRLNSILINRGTNKGDGPMAQGPTVQAARPISVRLVEDYRNRIAGCDTMSTCCDAKRKSEHLRVQFVDLRRWSAMQRAAPAVPFPL